MPLLPEIVIKKNHEGRLLAGRPWVYSNEIHMNSHLRQLPPGSLVKVNDHQGRYLGQGSFNPHSLIAFRLFTRQSAPIDRSLFERRIGQALALRQRLFPQPYYRLVHAEGDGLPGLVIDRFGDYLVIQLNSAGMELCQEMIVDICQDRLAPRAIVLRNDSTARRLEGLTQEVRIASGQLEPGSYVQIEEGGVRFRCDLLAGLKTGWFFDLANARDQIAGLSSGHRILDLYTHTGAFALRAAAAGAAQVLGIDRSAPAIALAQANAQANGLSERVEFRIDDGFTALQQLTQQNQQFDLVVCDPPNFAKTRRDLPMALKGYQKLIRLVTPLVRPSGFLFIASCSHHVTEADFSQAIGDGLGRAGIEGRRLFAGGAGADHPIHPQLPETAYIKWQILQLG